MDIKDRYAIAGIGYTPQGKVPERTAISFYLEAAANAIADAGLSKKDIDGLICYRYFPPGYSEPSTFQTWARRLSADEQSCRGGVSTSGSRISVSISASSATSHGCMESSCGRPAPRLRYDKDLFPRSRSPGSVPDPHPVDRRRDV